VEPATNSVLSWFPWPFSMAAGHNFGVALDLLAILACAGADFVIVEEDVTAKAMARAIVARIRSGPVPER